MNNQKQNFGLSDETLETFHEDFYENNLKCLHKLQEQRVQITQYILELAKLKLQINKDPLVVARKCLSLKTSAPTSISDIEKVPTSILFDESIKSQNYNTRKISVKQWKKNTSNTSVIPAKNCSHDTNKSQEQSVDAAKPPNFNKLWSEEEQLLLEHLLQVYPYEKSDMARCRKIANAMGTRTPRQIRSRMQKYYKKLKVFDKYQQSPSIKSEVKSMNKRIVNNSHKLNAKVFRKSTFLPRYNVREYISNEDISTSQYGVTTSIKQDGIDSEMKSDILMQLEAFRLQDSVELSCEHVGYKCVACEQEPIVGPRWHCVSCIHRTDLCCGCMKEYLESPQLLTSDQHLISHPFEVIITPSIGTFNDPDYLLHNFDSNNYLDPNFLPE